MTPAYRVLVCDLRTDTLLDVLPVTEVSVEDFIGKAGSLRATVPVPNREIADRVRPILQGGRTALWVERDRDIWWGGILWSKVPKVDERGFASYEIQAGTFDTYLEHRRLFDSLSADNVDQLDIARDLVDYAQNQLGGDIGIEYDTHLSGIKRSRSYSQHDQATIRELLDKLAGVENGFEWRVRCDRDPDTGRRRKLLELGYPHIVRGEADVVLAYPGPVLTYEHPEDATTVANVWQARGASNNNNQAAASKPLLSELLVDEQALADGWPRLDGTSDHSSVDDAATLNEHARAEAAAARRPQVIPAVTVRLDQDVTPDLIGRTVRLRIRDLLHPDGYDTRHRVVGITVTPPARDKGESATLTLEAAP
ncbi:hypothetical protein [Streptomyces gilvosporeus]|uniref:Uncharacterized protein n=1 Tax=Streptomyces gilvosporeus TaxID=553510 RepID=A0A1V0TST3_9ACTN|nr:hypothetical protein [Streptomyces gilvosporeus]ARF56006.1 hypothetical protein B1H19_19055 [Streptomyces gilvosporeus]